jgi:hypothetical protein
VFSIQIIVVRDEVVLSCSIHFLWLFLIFFIDAVIVLSLIESLSLFMRLSHLVLSPFVELFLSDPQLWVAQLWLLIGLDLRLWISSVDDSHVWVLSSVQELVRRVVGVNDLRVEYVHKLCLHMLVSVEHVGHVNLQMNAKTK